MPNAVLESMACERLSIVAETADNDEIIQNGFNGLKFPADNARALAVTLARVMGMDPVRKQDMERQARRDVLERYSTGAMVQRYQNIYQHYAGQPYRNLGGRLFIPPSMAGIDSVTISELWALTITCVV